MWTFAEGLAIALCAIFSYEAIALKTARWPTITALIKRYTHLAIILGAAAFMVLGYVLGRGAA